jgi:hypothetical protein
MSKTRYPVNSRAARLSERHCASGGFYCPVALVYDRIHR